jgi:hypothetical protein
MRYQVGADELERVPSMAHRPDGTFRLVRSAPVGPTHAVAAASDAAACGIPGPPAPFAIPAWTNRGFAGDATKIRLPANFTLQQLIHSSALQDSWQPPIQSARHNG